ncbi:hypothetical protein SAMN02745130_02162 [Thiothrix eikelboomii]|uniref:Uncharacterized protein n=1 Tax=Thiothrix eikelboomii TaxID=92487 RepID=A0A1T4WUN1_9GAMM|nr:hypothetical protein [Thiothrix eikelboomii]SKA81080.1 hypothetical protein SAMN02745130_02162 [Thiothrix eikelboomii]
MKDEKITFRCTREQLQYLNAEAIKRSTPEKLFKPIDVLRDLIVEKMQESQSENKLAA